MLTILHPEVLSLVHNIPIGLVPLRLDKDERPKLVIKASKEVILTAKMNQEFRIYAAPVFVQNKHTMGLVTAFFDNEDEPLALYTPLFCEPDIEILKDALLCSKLDIYFFDENNRELLGYTANLECKPHTRSFIEKTQLLPFDFPSAKSSIVQVMEWFGHRNPNDDLSAITVKFAATLFPEDFVIQDLMPQRHSYHGSEPFSTTQLVREEPGPFQERDIVQLLHRLFLPEQIYLGPLRVTDKKEIVDVLVVAESYVLFIQAKDNPNTERIAQNSISRKKVKAEKSLRKAVSQMKGALRYARSNTPMRIITGGKETEIVLEDREIRTLIIVKELFNDEYSEYSHIILPFVKENQVPCIALDFPELHTYTSYLSDKDAFFTAYDRVFMHGINHGVFPRLRIWPHQ